MIKNFKILVFTIYLFSFMYANTCNTAEDYGIINSGTILSGNFSSDGDDYWISFTTTCEFQNILLSKVILDILLFYIPVIEKYSYVFSFLFFGVSLFFIMFRIYISKFWYIFNDYKRAIFCYF